MNENEKPGEHDHRTLGKQLDLFTFSDLVGPGLPLWTPKGHAQAHICLDYGMDQDLQWVCFLTGSGECWTFMNKDIRLVDNATVGRVQADHKAIELGSVPSKQDDNG